MFGDVGGLCHHQLGWSQRAGRLPCSKAMVSKRNFLGSDVPNPNLIGSPDILKPNHHQPIFDYWALNQMQWSVQGVLVSGSAQATVKFWQAASKFRTLQICSSTNFARYSYTYMIRPSMAGVYGIYRSSTIFGSSKKQWYHNLKTLDSIMSNQSQSVLAFLAVTLHAYSRFVTLVIRML